MVISVPSLVVVAAAILLSGCGGGETSAAQKECERLWPWPGGLTAAKMVRAAGQPDQIAWTQSKDVHGKPLPYDRWLWRDGTVIIVNRKTRKVVFAVCDLRSIGQTPTNYLSDQPATARRCRLTVESDSPSLSATGWHH